MNPVKSPVSPRLLLGMQRKASELNTTKRRRNTGKLFGELFLCLIHYRFFFIFLLGKVSVSTQEHTHSPREQQGSNSNLYYESQGTVPPDSATIIKKGVSQIFLKKQGPVQRPNIETSLPLTLVRTQSVHTFLNYCFSVSKTCKMVLLVSGRYFWNCRINSHNCLSGWNNTLIRQKACNLWIWKIKHKLSIEDTVWVEHRFKFLSLLKLLLKITLG